VTTIRFGAACDGPGFIEGGKCPVYWNNYSTEDIITCSDCGDDFCPACVLITHHLTVRSLDDICCRECPGPSLACPDDPSGEYEEKHGART
jgi:hypothetical protein